MTNLLVGMMLGFLVGVLPFLVVDRLRQPRSPDPHDAVEPVSRP